MKEIFKNILSLIKEYGKSVLYLSLGLAIVASFVGPESNPIKAFFESFLAILLFFIGCFAFAIVFSLFNKR